MESKWHLFPGQTLENTNISDRVHALHISKTAWNGITKHLDRKKLLQEAADKEAAVKKYLDEGSKNMTKGWENSLENVRRRKEEERLQMIEQKKEERQQRFLELRKEQEEIRTKYMDKVKKQIFMTTGHARDLTSALVMSEILYERQKQQEFMNKLKQHEKEEDKVYLEYQKNKEKEDIRKDEEKQQKVLEKEKKYAQELKKIIEERNSLKNTLEVERVRKEAIDNIEAVKEMEKMDKLLIENKLRRKKELFDERKEYLKQQKEVELQRVKEDKELDEVVQIYRDTKHRIDCMKKEREKELRDIEVQRREKIAALVMREQQDKTEAEERAMKKAMAEREATEMEKIKAKREHEAKMKEERLKNRDEVLAREAEKKRKEEELKKWELLNRYKTDENMKIYEENKRKELWHEIVNYRNILCEQMEENRMELLREKEIDDASMKQHVKGEDTKFLKYANEVLELAKKKGRSTLPIERVIKKYIKEMHIDSNDYKTDGDLGKSLEKNSRQRYCHCTCPKK